MLDFVGLVTVGVSAFIATNIDDIFVLKLFFSNRRFSTSQVIIGQYFGIGLLVAISTLGSLLALVVPQYIIGLLGFVPISIGIISLVQLRKKDNHLKRTDEKVSSDKWRNHFSVFTVAAVTFSNGGDNIGIYTSLFAKYNSAIEIGLISTIFMLMTAVWCLLAYYLVKHPIIANKLHKLGHIIFPFVIIGLGIYILTSSVL